MLHGIYGSVSLSAGVVGRNTKGNWNTERTRPLKRVLEENPAFRDFCPILGTPMA